MDSANSQNPLTPFITDLAHFRICSVPFKFINYSLIRIGGGEAFSDLWYNRAIKVPVGQQNGGVKWQRAVRLMLIYFA